MKYTKTEQMFILRWAKKLRAIKVLGGKCIKCGQTHPLTLEFHHEKEKEYDVSRLIIHGKRWSVIQKEIKQCVLVCRNCHAELHSSPYGRNYIDKKRILGNNLNCSKCGYVGENLASIDFHHEYDKSFHISDIWNRKSKVSAETIEKELQKCTVLCKNCHVITMIDVEQFERLKNEIVKRSKEHRELRKPVDKQVVLRLSKHMKQIEIAKKIGCSKSTICKILKELSSKG